MITQEVVQAIAEIAEVDQRKAKRIYAILIRSLVNALKQDGSLKLPKIGKFMVRQKKPYLGVHPRTLERINISPRKTVFFQPSTVIKRLLEE